MTLAARPRDGRPRLRRASRSLPTRRARGHMRAQDRWPGRRSSSCRAPRRPDLVLWRRLRVEHRSVGLDEAARIVTICDAQLRIVECAGDGVAPARVRWARRELGQQAAQGLGREHVGLDERKQEPEGEDHAHDHHEPSQIVGEHRIDLQNSPSELVGEKGRQEQQRRGRDRDEGASTGTRSGTQAREVDDEDRGRHRQPGTEQDPVRRGREIRCLPGLERIRRAAAHALHQRPAGADRRREENGDGERDGEHETPCPDQEPLERRAQPPDRVGQADVEVQCDERRICERAERVPPPARKCPPTARLWRSGRGRPAEGRTGWWGAGATRSRRRETCPAIR